MAPVALLAEAGPAALAPEEEAASDRQFVTALARGLDILSCFSSARTEIGGTEIASLLGLPQPTVWRLCHTMTKLGYLTTDPDEKLRPGLPVLRLGYTVLSDLSLAELAEPHLQDLATRIGGAAGVAIRDGRDMRFIQRWESDSQLVMNLRVGSRVPIATSSLGWAYLAGLSPQAREAFLAEAAPNPQLWASAGPALAQAMRDYDEHGFIVNAGVFHPGYNTAATVIRGPDGLPACAINAGAAGSVISERELYEEVGPRLAELARLLESVA